jgi:hypothetical protein
VLFFIRYLDRPHPALPQQKIFKKIEIFVLGEEKHSEKGGEMEGWDLLIRYVCCLVSCLLRVDLRAKSVGLRAPALNPTYVFKMGDQPVAPTGIFAFVRKSGFYP